MAPCMAELLGPGSRSCLRAVGWRADRSTRVMFQWSRIDNETPATLSLAQGRPHLFLADEHPDDLLTYVESGDTGDWKMVMRGNVREVVDSSGPLGQQV